MYLITESRDGIHRDTGDGAIKGSLLRLQSWMV
jgi:hypothetical protein